MSKMDAPSMQDVYILSPVSGLYGTRSDMSDSDYVDYYDGTDGDDNHDSAPLQRGAGSHVM